jgi:hypothetical protein
MRLPHGFCALPPRSVERDRCGPRHRVPLASLLFSCLVSFMPGSVLETSNTRRTLTWGHGTCQALAATSCTKQISRAQPSCLKALTRQRNRTANVRSIGRLESSGFPFMPRWLRTGARLRTGLSPLSSVAWHFPSSIEIAGEQRFVTVLFFAAPGTQHAREFVEDAEVREALQVSRRDRPQRVRSSPTSTNKIEGR